MADDIVEQLRLHRVAACRERSCMVCDCADEIERLREERDEARAEASMKGYRLDDALDEIERLRAAIDSLLADIDTYHRPVWVVGRAKATGKQPWCCALCGATDGEWPCIHRRALDKLKEARRG